MRAFQNTVLRRTWRYSMDKKIEGFRKRHGVGELHTSCISIIQRSQSKILRMIVDAPWYVSNATLHAGLSISYVQDFIHQKCNKHHTTLETHENPAPQNTTGKRRKQATL
jgi:hypothetical protein